MYDNFYGFSQIPFGLSPDVRFCYRHRSYARARAYMDYALHRGEGFVVVTGRPGTGKTTLIQDLLKDLGPPRYLVARIDSTQLDADDLLRLVTYSFGVKAHGLDKATLLYRLREFLLGRIASDSKAILIVDEAQNLSGRALEELRLITNLQHGAEPLIQIFLVGQEPLRDLIRDPSLEQLHQRVMAACHLEPLGIAETRAYIQHRLTLAGWSGNPVIKAGALRLIFKVSAGVPRLINKVCDRLLLHGSLEERDILKAKDAQIVLSEFREELLDRIDSERPDSLPLEDFHTDGPEVEDLIYEPSAPPRTVWSKTVAGENAPQEDADGEAPPTVAGDLLATRTANATGNEEALRSKSGVDDSTHDERTECQASASGTPTDTAPATPLANPDFPLPSPDAPVHPDETSTRPEITERSVVVVQSGTDTDALGAEEREQDPSCKTAPTALSRASKGDHPAADGRRLARREPRRPQKRAFAVAAGVLITIGGIGYLLHSRGPDRLAADVSALGITVPKPFAAIAGWSADSIEPGSADSAVLPTGPNNPSEILGNADFADNGDTLSSPVGDPKTDSAEGSTAQRRDLASSSRIGEHPTPGASAKPRPEPGATKETPNVEQVAYLPAALETRTSPLTAVEALAAEAGAPESGYLSAATNNILGASRVPNTRRAAGVATLSAEPRPNNGPAIRDPVPEASVPVTATDEGPSDTPAIESESFDPHSKPEPKAEEQVPATTVASREPSEATEAPPPNGRESQGTEVTIVSESESSDGPSPETVEEETTHEADADTAELPKSGVSITGETEIGTIREELRGLGYQVREHENGDISLNLWEAVPFAFDSAEVPPRAHESLQELADIFLRNTNTKVKIVGHTDDRGPSQYNKRLSLQRAQAVEAYLHGKGLPKERLYSEGRGEDAPSSLGESDEVHSPRQRRTEILVQPLASRY